MSSFLLSALQRSTSHSYILLSSSWFDAYYIIPPPTSFMLTSFYSFTTLRVCMSMFHSFLPLSLFDRHSLLISITLAVRVLFIGLVSIIVVFRTTHAHVSIFVMELRTANLHFAAYSPALPFALDRRRSHPPTFVLARSSLKLTAPLYTTSHLHATHVLIFLNSFLSDLLSLLLFVTCLVLPHRIFRNASFSQLFLVYLSLLLHHIRLSSLSSPRPWPPKTFLCPTRLFLIFPAPPPP